MKVCLSEFGQRLKKLRHAKKLSQWDVARIVGCTQGAITIWEHSSVTPHEDTAAILARIESAPDGLGLHGRPNRVDARRREMQIDAIEAVDLLEAALTLSDRLQERGETRKSGAYVPALKALDALATILEAEADEQVESLELIAAAIRSGREPEVGDDGVIRM